MTAVRDLDTDTDQRARLAARLTDELGEPAVNRWRDGITVLPPKPGTAVLACQCGRVLNATDMHRPPRPANTGAAPLIDPIACKECAA